MRGSIHRPLPKSSVTGTTSNLEPNKEKEAKIYYDKAIKINPNDYKLKYAYCTLLLKINNFTSSWDLFDSRLLIDKNRAKLNNFELVKNNLFENLKLNPENKILILREQGIGEEILFSSVYQESIDKFKNIKIEIIKYFVSGNKVFFLWLCCKSVQWLLGYKLVINMFWRVHSQ